MKDKKVDTSGKRTDLVDRGSRVRVRASQEIGNGFSALAAFEIRFTQNGTVGDGINTKRLFGGFAHKDIGSLTFGNQLTLGDHIPKANYSYELSGNVLHDSAAKAVHFMSSKFAGFRVAADYYFGEANKAKADEGQGFGVGAFYDGQWGDVGVRFGSGYIEVKKADAMTKDYKQKIAGVGFDLYLRLVGEAVANYRGEKEEREVETKIDLPVNAHIPHTYIDSERLRLQAYRQIAAADTEEKIAEAREELVDRYGELPEAVENLLAVATVRMHARAAGIHELVVLGPKVRVVTATPLPESRQMRLKRVYPGSTHAQPKGMDTWLTLVPRPKTMPVGGKELVDRPMLEWAEKFINSIYAQKPQALEE